MARSITRARRGRARTRRHASQPEAAAGCGDDRAGRGILTLHEKPPPARTGRCELAKVAALSPSSVQRIWAAHGLKPHLTRGFKLSDDPQFCKKVQDIVGVYLDPPDKAWCFRSTRGARSRRSTARKLDCR